MGQGSASSQITYSNYDFWLEYLEFERSFEEFERELSNISSFTFTPKIYDNDGND